MALMSYQDLVVWQKAMDFAVAIYQATANFPTSELYGLTAQIRRCSVSIPSNIAEGQGRTTSLEFVRFLAIARGSINEIETQILLAQRLNYLNEQKSRQLLEQLGEVSRLLGGLIRSIRRKGKSQNPPATSH